MANTTNNQATGVPANNTVSNQVDIGKNILSAMVNATTGGNVDTDDVFSIPEGLMSDTDADALVQWMGGKMADPPMAVRRIMSNINQKMMTLMAVQVADQLTRVARIHKYVNEVEKFVYDPADIAGDDPDSRTEKYQNALKATQYIMDNTRKFVKESKDYFEGMEAGPDKLKQMIMSLPQSKIESLIEKLQKGEI